MIKERNHGMEVEGIDGQCPGSANIQCMVGEKQYVGKEREAGGFTNSVQEQKDTSDGKMTTKTDLRKPYTQAHALIGAGTHIVIESVFEGSSRVQNKYFKEFFTNCLLQG